MSQNKLFALHYYHLGMNVTCISNHINEHNFYCRNILKTPNHKWKHFFTTRQQKEEVENYEWNLSTGVGAVTGFGNIRVIDLDGCSDYAFLDEIIELLGLPKNYEWITVSGSNNGFHIFINCEKYSSLSEDQVITTFPPKNSFKHLMEKVEILWNTHVVLPPSVHKSGGSYNFLNCKFPKSLPSEVTLDKVSEFISKYLQADKKSIGLGYGEVLFEFIPSNVPSDLDEDDYAKLKGKTIICVVDIETDGLPKKTNSTIEFPNIVQIAWILLDTAGNIYKKDSALINYTGIRQTEAFSINNIDINLLKRIGKPPEEVLKSFISDVKVSDYVVAHNADFDLPIIKHQLSKHFLQDPFNKVEVICTMKSSLNYCQIYSYDSELKYPKLVELYKKLFDYEIQQKHNAESDALLTAKCFVELLNKGVITLKQKISLSSRTIKLDGIDLSDLIA